MKKFNFLSLLFVAVIGLPVIASAQVKMGAWGDATDPSRNNYYINYAGGRVSISSPSSLEGPVTHTIANDGTGSSAWGGGSIAGLANPILNVNIVKADPYEACGTLTNASAISGNIALIKRGNCEFGAKAEEAQNAGAVAVIIVNHLPGPPVGMGAGARGGNVTIPVIMVSDVDGAAIEAALASGNVTMSMTSWSNGYTNDIGFVDRGLSLWHAYAIPLNQVKNATSVPYKGFNAAVIGNFGTTTPTNITLKATLSWTPTGGSTSVVRTDSIVIPSFAPIDSILTPFMDIAYNLAPTTTGRYDVLYELPNDDFSGDNKASYSFYVTDRIYSKGRYDFTNNRPLSSVGYRLGDSSAFVWGNMMYMEKADYIFESVQLSLSKSGEDNSMAGTDDAIVLVWEWVDANGDSIMIGDECNLVGQGLKKFVAGDTSGQVHRVEIKDASNGTTPIVTKANSWYWVSIEVPRSTFMAVDGISNYFVRSWGRSHATADTREPYSPMYQGTYTNIIGLTTPLQHFPFESYYFLEDSIRFSQQKKGLVPTIPLQLSLFPVDVAEVEDASPIDISLYPNPATDVVNIALNLDSKADEVSYTVVSTTGVAIKKTTHRNVINDTYAIPTSSLPAGTYFVLVNIDDSRSAVRKFTVIK
ncbi:MAG TPA: PA domain-containing protein [Flavipsychrobacter sp.]